MKSGIASFSDIIFSTTEFITHDTPDREHKLTYEMPLISFTNLFRFKSDDPPSLIASRLDLFHI